MSGGAEAGAKESAVLCSTKTLCPLCNKLIYETTGGKFGLGRKSSMYAHKNGKVRCEGSGRTVDEALEWGRQNGLVPTAS